MVTNLVLLCFIIFELVTMFMGVGGNIAVIILTRTSKFWSKEKTETSYLVGNLALADLLMCLTLYPAWIVEFTLTILDIESDQVLFCKFSRSFTFSLLFASVASLLTITVDRYIYIVKPLKYPLIVTRRRVFVVIFAIWLTASCILTFLYVHIANSDAGLRSVCFISPSISYPVHTLVTYVPVSVIIILNFGILRVSRKQRKKILAETLPLQDNNTNENLLDMNTRMKVVFRFLSGLKAAKTFSIVVAVLIFGIFFPTLVGSILYNFCSEACREYLYIIVLYQFYGINSVVNAFIYGMRHVKYRKACGKLFLKVTSNFKMSK